MKTSDIAFIEYDKFSFLNRDSCIFSKSELKRTGFKAVWFVTDRGPSLRFGIKTNQSSSLNPFRPQYTPKVPSRASADMPAMARGAPMRRAIEPAIRQPIGGRPRKAVE